MARRGGRNREQHVRRMGVDPARLPDGLPCPHCGFTNTYFVQFFRGFMDRPMYRCEFRRCRQFWVAGGPMPERQRAQFRAAGSLLDDFLNQVPPPVPAPAPARAPAPAPIRAPAPAPQPPAEPPAQPSTPPAHETRNGMFPSQAGD